MPLKEDLISNVKKIFKEQWTTRDGRVVPEPSDLQLSNDAINLDATILYADLADSTIMVDAYRPSFAAEIYKSYLMCAAKIIKEEGGVITAYDGDRVMAVYLGDRKNEAAARTALKINYAVSEIINPAIIETYGAGSYQMKHVIGIDTSKIMVARIGVRNDNDLVWVGRAANYAAKLSALNECPVYITEAVFNSLTDCTKYGGNEKKLMWVARTWTAKNNMRIYSSTWRWSV